VDPARTANVASSDRTGRVVLSRLGTRIYVHASSGEFWKPDEIIRDAFETSRRYDAATVAIEKNSLDEWLLQPMRAEMLRRGESLPLKAIQAPQDRSKEAFIMGLQPFFEAGDIVLVGGRGAHPQLVAEILNFPSGKRDILNALAYAQRVFSGTAVYEDFSERNITSEYEPSARDALALCFNATGSDTVAVLVSVEGERLVAVADWVSPVPPAQAVPDIMALTRAAFPRARLTCWMPSDVMDQQDRMPLMAALRAAGLQPMRGAYSTMARGALSPLIRTEMKGRKLFLVDSRAKHTLNALAGGYNFGVAKNGQQNSEPERGPHRTLMEALESAASVICSSAGNSLPDELHSATNPQGAQYFTSLPRRN
jgi:predicted phage terminase large subunit-like protein